jgi:hypothetical protein
MDEHIKENVQTTGQAVYEALLKRYSTISEALMPNIAT